MMIVPVVTGPTAVGKTDVAVKAAEVFRGEIISADSMQIYRYMTIGTAKPSEEERQRVPHYLVDCVNPDERFTAADFQHKALSLIEQIQNRGKIPFVVGGTGLYLHSLLFDMNFSEISVDWTFRKNMEEEARQHGKEFVYEKLKTVDSEAAKRIHPHNLKRVIRALEIATRANQPMADFSRDLVPNKNHHFVVFVLSEDRQILYERINKRVDLMIRDGLVKEVEFLMALGYHENHPAMQGVGYKEIIDYLKGTVDFEEAVHTIKRNTRRFAKRQYTWFRKLPGAQWIHLDPAVDRQSNLDHAFQKIVGGIESASASRE